LAAAKPPNGPSTPVRLRLIAHDEHPVHRGFSIQSRLSLEYWITRSSAQLRTSWVMTTAFVAEWHSKFHAMARGIEATPMKK
jgi:hypothetical protein